MTRACHCPSEGTERMFFAESTCGGSKGQGESTSSTRSRCPDTTQLCVTGSRRISMSFSVRVTRGRRACFEDVESKELCHADSLFGLWLDVKVLAVSHCGKDAMLSSDRK